MKTAKSRFKLNKLEARKEKWGYFFLLPWLAIFCVFYAYPLIYGIFVSFCDYSLNSMEFCGVENYVNIFKDYTFWRSLLATFKYAILVIPLSVFIPLFAANVLRYHGKTFNTLTKLVTYIPGVTCAVALILSWKFMFDPSVGVINTLLECVGVSHFSVFDNPQISIPVMSVLVASTGIGSNLIIYCAALGAIPTDYYEAAELDGASRMQQFWNITVPLLNPTIVYVFITSTIGCLQIFVIPQLMTGGGPNYTTSTLLMLIYDAAFTGNQFGYASAIGVVLFVITALIAVIQFKVTQKETVEY